MKERKAVIGRDFRIFIEGIDLGMVASCDYSGDGPVCIDGVEYHLRDYYTTTMAIGKGCEPDLDISAFALRPRPKTHPRSPRESLKRHR